MARILVVPIIALLLLLGGCGPRLPALQTFARPPAGGTCRVALLPFVNHSDYPQGALIAMRILQAELMRSGRFTVLPEGDVREIYRELKMYPNERPTREQLEIIGGRMDAGIFIGGEILTMQEDDSGLAPKSRLTMILRLYDGATGKMFWSTYHRRRSEDYRQVLHFGRINTVTSLVRRMIDEIIALWREQGLQPCEPH